MIYTPASGFVGQERFTYALSDAIATGELLIAMVRDRKSTTLADLIA